MKPFAAGTLLLCAIVAGAQVGPTRISPGKQLGKLNVGDVMEDMRWLSRPNYGDAASGRQWQTWEAKKPDPRNGKIINSLDVYTTVNDAGKYQIRLIRSTSPSFATTGKIKVGSTLKEIKHAFPKIAKIAEYSSAQFSTNVALYDEPAQGIAFEFKQGAKGSVAEQEKCLAVWVHEPGMDLMNEPYPATQYLPSKGILRRAAKQGKG